jgi:serine/threonine-protein kinase PpkA
LFPKKTRVSLPEIPGHKIQREIGAGGMARVYLAQQITIDRPVALKVMAPALVADAAFSKRFLREAQMLANLTHPNIVAVYEVGATTDHLHYFSMQHLSGGDFAHRIHAGMTEAEVVRVVSSIARALGYAHSRGVVHRDVTPGNILFDSAENPVLTDFGIARSQHGSTRITHTGVSIGTSSYMSPEQARGGEVDQRSDLYSLGALTFEAITGHPPYRGADGFAVAYAHVFEPIPRLPQQVAHWQPFIDKILAKDPEERFANADQFVVGLGDVPINPQRIVPQRALPKTPPIPTAMPVTPASMPPIPTAAQENQPTLRSMPSDAQALETVRKTLANAGQAPKQTIPPPKRSSTSNDEGAGRAGLMPVIVIGAISALAAGGGFWWWQHDGAAPRPEPEPTVEVATPAERTTVPEVQVKSDGSNDPALAGAAGTDGNLDPTLDPSIDPAPNPSLDPSLDPLLNPDATPSVADPKPRDFGPPTRERYIQPLLEQAQTLQKKNACFGAKFGAVESYRIALQTLPTAAAALKGVDECFALLPGKVDALLAAETADYPKFALELALIDKTARAFGPAHASAKLVTQERARLLQAFAARAASEEQVWHTTNAKKWYAAIQVFEPKNAAAAAGIARAERIGQPGYSFKDSKKGPELVIIASGDVRMRDAAGGGATVRIGQNFAIAKTEVTLAQYTTFVNQSRHSTTAKGCNNKEGLALFTSKTRTWKSPGFEQSSGSPVVCVGWNDAQAYVRWLSQETGEKYRLLSEAEWQLVAADSAAPNCSNSNIGDSNFAKIFEERGAYTCSDNYAGTAPVGSFGANRFGVVDLSGNAREWVADCWNASISAHPKTGAPWLAGRCTQRVAMGTGWVSKPEERSALTRSTFAQDDLNNTVGFRVARDVLSPQ